MRCLRFAVLVALVFGAACGPEPITVQISAPAIPVVVTVGEPIALQGAAFTAAGDPALEATLTWTSSLQGAIGTGPLVLTALEPGVHRIALTGTWGTYTHQASRTLLVRPPAQNPAAYLGALAAANLPGSKAASKLIRWTQSKLPNFLLGNPPKFPPGIQEWLLAHPTNVHGAVGNGRLTAGVSSRGVLTVLRWPSPSHPDHLDYIASDYDAPEMGSLPNLGAFAGVRYKTPAGTAFTWLRDPAWSAAQQYLSDESNALRTTFVHAGLGLTVHQIDFVAPAKDVLVRRFEVSKAAGSPVTAAWMVHYQNLAPCTYRIPRAPVTDGLLDFFNDFAVLYHSGEQAIVHFRPWTPDYQPLLAFAAAPHADLQADVDEFVDQADANFGSGVYFAIGSEEPGATFDCGHDGQDDPFETAANPQGRPYSFVRGASVLRKPLALSGGTATATFLFAAGPTALFARNRLAWARAIGSPALLAQTEAWWANWIAPAAMPNTTDPQVLRVCKRGLISIRTATATSGAIPASVSVQPPYALDWPRDGAFLNLALDLAGYRDLVTKHNLFYAESQRANGSYEMNYWGDGMPGGPILLEIDNIGMATWSLWNHAGFLSGAEKTQYLAAVYPAIKKGAQFLVTWKDPFSGLPAPANEDDNPAFTQGIQGSVAALLGIRSAIEAAQATGDLAVVPAWNARLQELKSAILAKFYDSSTGAYGLSATGGAPGSQLRGAAWFLWPGEVKPLTDTSLLPHGQALWQKTAPFFQAVPGVYSYNAEHLLSLAHLWKAQGVNGPLLAQALHKLTHDLPTPGTSHYAETYRVSIQAGIPTYRNLNNVPHLWEHALVYLAARKILE